MLIKSLRSVVPLLSLPLVFAAGLHAAPATLADFQALAAQAHAQLVLPVYPVTPAEVKAQVDSAISTANAALDKLAAQDPTKLTFASTFGDYDAIGGAINNADQIIGTVAQSNPDKAMRDTANEVEVKLSEWGVALDYREDIYRVLKAFVDTKPVLDAQEQRLVDDQMRSFRRAGLALPPAERAEVEKLRKQLAGLKTQFEININEARSPLDFTAAELAGVPQSFLDSPGVKQADGRYRVMANITWHAQTVGESADNPETRRRLSIARNSLAKDTNIPLLGKLIALRAEIARRLGYATWADFKEEDRMSKTGATAVQFEEKLVTGLQPKFDAEMETLRALKATSTGQPNATLDAWDINYYTNKLLKEHYAVDNEKLRVFFPYQATLEGMFAIYQKIFGLKFTAVPAPYVWFPGVQLYAVQDSATGVPMGAFYLDMFPREGKYNHFACFGQKIGGVMADGRYDLPVAALLCNFPAPAPDKPSLLKHDDVETLFHEFGHVMHSMLGRSRFTGQSSFTVPRDFVEAPSQMLENWPWDKAVLDTFAADYRDPTRKIPAETIAAMVAAREATEGAFTRRQLAYGLVDLSIHHVPSDVAAHMDLVAVTNAVLTRVAIAPPTDTAFVAYFGHLASYDAGYYGYLWSKVLAQDMASEFKKSPNGFLDEKVGRRLRDEVYGVGNTRDVATSVEIFLGRPRSQDAFLEFVGIKNAN